MKIPLKNYTFESFCDMLAKNPEYLPDLKILCFLTIFESWRPPGSIVNLEYIFGKYRFSISSLGEIKKLTAKYRYPETEELIPICKVKEKKKRRNH